VPGFSLGSRTASKNGSAYRGETLAEEPEFVLDVVEVRAEVVRECAVVIDADGEDTFFPVAGEFDLVGDHVAADGFGGEQDDEGLAIAEFAVDHFDPLLADTNFRIDKMGNTARFEEKFLVGIDMAVADKDCGQVFSGY
jgi:hypothetical protein